MGFYFGEVNKNKILECNATNHLQAKMSKKKLLRNPQQFGRPHLKLIHQPTMRHLLVHPRHGRQSRSRFLVKDIRVHPKDSQGARGTELLLRVSWKSY